jgi:hypothetical protein
MSLDKEYMQLLVDTDIVQLIEEYTKLIGKINHTISEIAIGYITDNYKLIEMENDVGFDHAFDMVYEYETALKLKGFEVKPNKFVHFPEVHYSDGVFGADVLNKKVTL